MIRGVFLLFILIFNLECIGQSKVFLEYKGWSAVKSRASLEKKQILLYFGAPWCAPCVQLLKGVFSDSATQGFLTSHFNSYQFDYDSSNSIPFLKKYAITAIPALLILNEEGYLKANVQGIPQEVPAFTETIGKIVQSAGYYKGISNSLEIKYPVFYNTYYLTKQQVTPDSITVVNYLKSQTDLFSEANWNVLNLFNTSEEYFDFILSNKDRYKELFGDTDIGFKLYHIYTIFYRKYVHTRDSVGFNMMIKKYLPKETDPNYTIALKSFYKREIKFLAETGMDWDKFMNKANYYDERFGNADNHFICSYALNVPISDSINNFLLSKIQPVLVSKPDANTYMMYGAFLMRAKRQTEAEMYFNKILETARSDEDRKAYQNKINDIKSKYATNPKS